MENKYSRGKIYKIVDNTNGNIYIGSTIETLKERLRKHIQKKDCACKNIFENDDYKIELIKDYPCESEEELNIEEQKYINEIDCINKNRAYRTEEEEKEYKRGYRKEYNKKYYEKNKKEYNEKRKEKILCNDCNSMIRKSDISAHRKTQKHINSICKSLVYDIIDCI